MKEFIGLMKIDLNINIFATMIYRKDINGLDVFFFISGYIMNMVYSFALCFIKHKTL